jgi:hypothetical protein
MLFNNKNCTITTMIVLAGDWAPADLHVELEFDFDLLMVNLEGPILTKSFHKPAKKVGPHLFTSVFPKNASRMAFSLANNHSMDFGHSSLKFSIDELKMRGALFAGYGENTERARETVFFHHDGFKWAWISACEPQFGISTTFSAGLASTGAWMIQSVQKASKISDFVIVSIHGGNEDLPWPSPQTVEFYRSLADAGASVIHGHHSHVPQGFERYENTSIFYGLGNFAVNPKIWDHVPNSLWSLIVKFDKNSPDYWLPKSVYIKPIEEKTLQIQYIPKTVDTEVNQYLNFVNEPISNPKFLAGLWQESAFYLFSNYGAKYMSWDNSIQTILRRKLFGYARDLWEYHKQPDLRKFETTSEQNLLRYHMINCDSHRNVLSTVLGVLGGEIEDLRNSQTKTIFQKHLTNFHSIGNVF